MIGWRALALAACLWAQPVWASPEEYFITFEVVPRDAKVMLDRNVFGSSNEALRLIPKPGLTDSATYSFRLERPHMKNIDKVLTLAEIRASKQLTVPLGTMTPADLQGWFVLHPGALVGLGAGAGLLALGGVGFELRRRSRAREDEKLQTLRRREVGAQEDAVVGKRLGNYHLLERLGVGGMASVYRATRVDRPDEPEVAVKLLHPRSLTPEWRERYHREVTVLARLRHPHLILLYEPLEVEGRLGFVMELVRGQSLRALLEREGKLSPARIRQLIGPLVDCLSYLHGQGVVHRDLKPDNLLVAATPQGASLKLADFGIAHVLASDRLTASGTAIGSLPYMSPEQIRGAESTPETDQYALGVILFEMLSGRNPFQGDDVTHNLAQRLEQAPPKLSDFLSDATPQLEAVLRRMLASARTRRYPSVAEAWKDFLASS